MLRIYDEFELRTRLRTKRLHAVLLVAGSCMAGFWLGQSEEGVAMANPSSIRLAASPALTPRWCGDDSYKGPRFDCTLSQR